MALRTPTGAGATRRASGSVASSFRVANAAPAPALTTPWGEPDPPHLDLPNIGGDQLGVVDGCIVSDVPADRIDNNGLGYLLRHEAAGLARPQFGIQPAAAQQVTVAALFKDTAVIEYDQTVHGGNRREPMRNRDHGFA